MSLTEDDYLRLPGLVVREKLYDETGAVREWRYVNDDTLHFCGPKGAERRYMYVTCVRISLLTGPPGQEYEIKRWDIKQQAYFYYSDFRGRWRRTRRVGLDGRETYFEGEPWMSRKVYSIMDGKNQFTHYEGGRGSERPVYMYDMRDDAFYYYEGCDREARLVRAKFANGTVNHYAGPKNEEYLVKMECTDGDVQYYEGTVQGDERLVKRVSPDGSIIYYEGENGSERVWRRVTNEQIEFFREGEEYAERVMAAVLRNGDVEHYENTSPGRDMEDRILRKLCLDSGDFYQFEDVYSWGQGHSRKIVRELDKDGKLTKLHEGEINESKRKRKRLEEATKEAWAQLEALTEEGKASEQALVAMGKHFKTMNELTEAL